MKQLYGLGLFVWLIFEQINKANIDILGTASLLGALCLFIIKEKYLDRTLASVGYLIIAIVLAEFHKDFILLAGIPLMDFIYKGDIPVSVFIFLMTLYFGIVNKNYNNIFFIASSGILAHTAGLKERNEKLHLKTLDEERRLRYNLERAQNELVNSKKEIEHMTEIRERNRIAHEIHDNIGHSIAGIIFQIEAARRTVKKDAEKTEEILKLCSGKLSEALELTRNTVHNIRTDKRTGIDVIEKIIKDFKFCPVDFQHSGDFGRVPSLNLNVLEANIMEYLTNASKYSMATNINIRIDITNRNIRLYYKDNGVGCRDIRENLGLTGIRSRVRDIGGTVSIDGKDGFLIVCNLPVRDIEDGEGELF